MGEILAATSDLRSASCVGGMELMSGMPGMIESGLDG